MTQSAGWHFHEEGEGPPLILLHGIGMSHAAWSPVLPYLRPHRRVIAFDIPGFGASPPLPDGIIPTPSALAESLGEALAGLGLNEPVDMAGNSLGGYLSLEAAKQGLARSVVGVSPAGLWNEHGAAHVKPLFYSMHWGARYLPGLGRLAMRSGLLRELFLAAPVSAGSFRMPAADAVRALDDLATATAFQDTFSNTGAFRGGQNLQIPITIAFGSRDWVLTQSSQLRTQLPAHTRWLQPKGWGHVPMWVDPEGVAAVILEGTVGH